MNEQLQTLDLTQIAVTAMIDSTGRLGAVKGLWSKLLAAAREAATLGLLRIIVVATDQPDVPPELEHTSTSPLRILRASTLHEISARLYEEQFAQHVVVFSLIDPISKQVRHQQELRLQLTRTPGKWEAWCSLGSRTEFQGPYELVFEIEAAEKAM